MWFWFFIHKLFSKLNLYSRFLKKCISGQKSSRKFQEKASQTYKVSQHTLPVFAQRYYMIFYQARSTFKWTTQMKTFTSSIFTCQNCPKSNRNFKVFYMVFSCYIRYKNQEKNTKVPFTDYCTPGICQILGGFPIFNVISHFHPSHTGKI